MKRCIVLILTLLLWQLYAEDYNPVSPESEAVEITIWDDYLSDITDYAKLLNIMNSNGVTEEEIIKIIKVHGLKSSGGDHLKGFNNNLDITFVQDSNRKFKVKSIKSVLAKDQSIPLLGISQTTTLNELVGKFGKSYREGYSSPFILLASTSDPEGRKLNLKIEFKFNFSSSIESLIFTRLNDDNFNYKGHLYPIKAGTKANDCINGRGVYQYTNGFWVDGLFRDGNLSRGVVKNLDFIQCDYASVQLLLNPELPYKAMDESFWKEYFTKNSTLELLNLFNKKDYKNQDWDLLQEYYFFEHTNNYFRSPDNHYEIGTSYDGKRIEWIQLSIRNTVDLTAFGGKHYSYNEMQSSHGQEYFLDKHSYDAILMPAGDLDRNHHLKITFIFDYTGERIEFVRFSPVNPEGIMWNNDGMKFIRAGYKPRDGVDFQWSDGNWFKGTFKDGHIWSGELFTYLGEHSYATVTNGRISQGQPPTMLRDLHK
jgi:hypothetical protein